MTEEQQISRRAAMEKAVWELLNGMGLSTRDPGLVDTPRRVTDYLLEYSQSFDEKEVLGEGFANPCSHSGMIVQSNIPFRMICEHHLLPALGKAYLGYVAGKTIVGLSKLTRLVQAVGLERPSIQELVGDRIADILYSYLEPKGVISVIKAEHSCMACRGIAAPSVMTITSSVRGVFRDVPHARAEFFELISMGD